MSRPAKWSLHLLVFLAITFFLMLSGIFGPLAESLKYTVTNLMNYISTEKLELYPDRVEDNYFTMYKQAQCKLPKGIRLTLGACLINRGSTCIMAPAFSV
ncbi:hypothetical protein [unidentified bacterial endosymbiont]|uniref:hypothetical protein n=1 Tax=unidentified bacterial endosymbiont TaxID=2355 RepID=UPI00209C9A88|nr:hypothetical protein [unidentified bacterial endosymbiont]